MGEHPLYVYLTDQTISFSTSLHALWALPGVMQRTDVSLLPHYFFNRRINDPLTFYKNMYIVPAGSYLCIDAHWRLTCTYWYQWPVQQTTHRAPNTYVAALDALLSTSIKKRILTDVPVGVMLSGGIDSALLTAFLNRFATGSYTFSISFKEGNCGFEHRVARQISHYFKTNHTDILIGEKDVYDTVMSWMDSGMPLTADPYTLVFAAAFKRIKPFGVGVLLNGQGADELFSGHEQYDTTSRFVAHAWHYLQRGIAKPLRAMLVDRLLNYSYVHPASSYAMRLRLWQQGACVNEGYPALYDTQQLGLLLKQGCTPPKNVPLSYDECTSWVEQAINASHANTIQGAFCDRMYHAHYFSMSMRSPFIDHQIVNQVVPTQLSHVHASYKYPLHTLAQTVLPNGMAFRKRTRMSVPFSYWFRKGKLLNTHLMDLVTSTSHGWQEVLDMNYIQEMIKLHNAEIIDNGEQLWALYVLLTCHPLT
jgi:asparagine synthase (glutamine-hydrolysing)